MSDIHRRGNPKNNSSEVFKFGGNMDFQKGIFSILTIRIGTLFNGHCRRRKNETKE
jgi:hypothetical protein